MNVRKWFAAVRRVFGRGESAKTLTELRSALLPVASEFAGGVAPDDDVLQKLGTYLTRYFEALCRENGTESNLEFGPDDRADYYLHATMLGTIGHAHHTAWPILSSLRFEALELLQSRLSKSDDRWLRVAIIPPALARGNVALAARCWAELKDAPAERQVVLSWVRDMEMGMIFANRSAAVEPFLAEISEPGPWLGTPAMPHELHWICLTSVYPSLAYDPRTSLGDARSAATVRVALNSDWGVKDGPSALAMIKRLQLGAHTKKLQKDIQNPPPELATFLDHHRAELERHHIRAWDLCRGVAVTRSALTAGYISEAETTERLMLLGDALRHEFRSWEELGNDYILGVRYFHAPEDVEDDYHVELVRWLLTNAESPWKSVPFGGSNGKMG